MYLLNKRWTIFWLNCKLQNEKPISWKFFIVNPSVIFLKYIKKLKWSILKNSFWSNNFTWLLLFNSYQDYLVNISELWKVHTVDSNLSSFFWMQNWNQLNAKLKSLLCHRKLFTAWMLDKLFLETFLDLVTANSIMKF